VWADGVGESLHGVRVPRVEDALREVRGDLRAVVHALHEVVVVRFGEGRDDELAAQVVRGVNRPRVT
jgi:hypothetical protein